MNKTEIEILRALMSYDGGTKINDELVVNTYLLGNYPRRTELKILKEMQSKGLVKIFRNPGDIKVMSLMYVVQAKDAAKVSKAGWNEKYICDNLDIAAC